MICALAACASTGLASSQQELFGDQNLEPNVDYVASGQAAAFSFYGAAGTAQSISVYVDSSNSAVKLTAGIYQANPVLSGTPLLAQGSLSSPVNGAWNTITISSTSVSASNVYWVAIMGTGGTLSFRDKNPGTCTAYNSSQTGLSSLPTSFSEGTPRSACTASVTVNGTMSTGSPPPTNGTTSTAPPSPVPPGTTSVSTVVAGCCRYGTYQAQNHRIAYTSAGIFASWISAYDSTTQDGTAEVVRSTDNGSKWTTLLTIPITGGYHAPPSLEADSAGNVYAFLASGGWPLGSDTRDARMYIFAKASNFANDGSDYTVLPNGNTGKFTSGYDPSNNDLYYVRAGGPTMRWYTISASTHTLTNTYDIATEGPNALPHYPHLLVDRSGSGDYVLAWTTSPCGSLAGLGAGNCNGAVYYDNRFVYSRDHGAHWIGANGQITRFPFSADDTGPSFELNDPDELNGTSGYMWMGGTFVQDGYFMMTYGTNHGHDWLRRFSLTTNTRDTLVGPSTGNMVCGSSICINTPGTVFSGNGTAGARIYLTGGMPSTGDIGTIYSDDDGATWHDYSRTIGANWGTPYAVSGAQTLGPNGEVTGAFTDGGNNNVRFFHTN